MNELKRYDFEADYDMTNVDRVEHPQGDYVLYSEAAALLDEKDARIAHLTAERDQALAWGGDFQRKIAEKDEEIARLRHEVGEDTYRYGFAIADNQRLREALECLVECVEMRGFGKAYAIEISKQALAATAQGNERK